MPVLSEPMLPTTRVILLLDCKGLSNRDGKVRNESHLVMRGPAMH